MAEPWALLLHVQLVWIVSSSFPKGLQQFAFLPTAFFFVPIFVTISSFHFSHSGGLGQRRFIFIFISVPIVGKFVF